MACHAALEMIDERHFWTGLVWGLLLPNARLFRQLTIPAAILAAKIPLARPEDNPFPRDVAVTPDNTRAYVTLRGTSRVASSTA